jgi:23S rRNA pseudouridine2605 synthase
MSKPSKESPPTTVKIQKILANHGLASRRTIEQWLVEGRIIVNNKKAVLGDRMSLEDTVQVDGKVIHLKPKLLQPQILMYHKPIGEICSKEEGSIQSVFKALPKPDSGRWVMIGRLDVTTSGLLLFTNSGDLAHQMMHPKFGLMREYLVRVLGEVTPEIFQNLKNGVMLEDGFAEFEKITQLAKGKSAANQWFQVMLSEGRNREVRRMFESQGLTVSRLIRIRFGKYQLPRDLAPGDWRICE